MSEFALWISSFIDEFEKRDDVELHVVSPYLYLKVPHYEFTENSIHYHFYRWNLPFPFNYVYKLFNRNYRLNRKYVQDIVKEINPDIVNLVGAENPYYSVCALDIEDIPVYVLCQTVYSNPQRYSLQTTPVSKERWDIEQKIFKKFSYFGCTGQLYYNLIKEANDNAIIFPTSFPTKNNEPDNTIKKEFDFVWYAAQVSKKKGIDDALEALALVKCAINDVSLVVIGTRSSEIDEYLEETINKHNLSDNVVFHEPFEDHNDLLRYIQKVRFALLPVKMDVISLTIKESMQLGLPVVTSITSGTPTLNKEKETVLLSEIGDVSKLADNMIKLMKDVNLQNTLRNNAFEWIANHQDNAKIVDTLIQQYNAIIAENRGEGKINPSMLFNVN